MFFQNCTNLDELKKAYRAACLANHPDCGGDCETMKKINIEYKEVFEKLKKFQNQAAEKGEAKKTTETPEEFIEIVNKLLVLEDIEVELCGSWLWIAGDTFNYKDELKQAGCLWSRSKRKWYWRHAEDSCRWSRGSSNMAEIRDKYGSEWLVKTTEKNLITA